MNISICKGLSLTPTGKLALPLHLLSCFGWREETGGTCRKPTWTMLPDALLYCPTFTVIYSCALSFIICKLSINRFCHVTFFFTCSKQSKNAFRDFRDLLQAQNTSNDYTSDGQTQPQSPCPIVAPSLQSLASSRNTLL